MNRSRGVFVATLLADSRAGPISTRRLTTRGFDGRNFNFPEESATYWLARINIPSGASLTLAGRYPRGRHMSLNAAFTRTATAHTYAPLSRNLGELVVIEGRLPRFPRTTRSRSGCLPVICGSGRCAAASRG